MAYGTVKKAEVLALISGGDQTIGDLVAEDVTAEVTSVDTLAVTVNAPGDNTAGVALIGQKDSSVATKATLDIETEEVVAAAALTTDKTLAVWVNGVEYLIGLKAV